MLVSLKINDVAIIEEATIQYEKGLNVMTGETGSGKSIIIDSINAVLGERTSKELIRDTAEFAKVTAVFDSVSEKVKKTLLKYGIETFDDSLMISRTIKDGRNICKINGENVTVTVLREIGKYLINIHGQNDNQALLNSDNHIGYIDLLAKNHDLLNAYKVKYNELKAINRRLKKLTIDENEKERRIETLKHQIEEIESAKLKAGERESLINLKKRQQNIEKVRNDLVSCLHILDGNDENSGVLSLLYTLSDKITSLGDCYEEINEFSESVENAIAGLSEFSNFVSNELSLDSDDLLDINAIEERLDLIYRLSRKYGNDESEILGYLEKIRTEYNELDLNSEYIEKTTAEYNKTLEELLVLGNKLTVTRTRAGEDFSKRITQELQYLDMKDAVFSVDISPAAVTASGLDSVQFLISTNRGQTLKPLSKIASGGELSRIMLAIKCVLTNEDEVGTLIFDEIDSGVSGLAAEKIGRKLKEVSMYSQVICVTHLAQIASFADNHLFIQKTNESDKTLTKVKALSYDERKHEIARIMGGSLITETTLASAEELLKRNKKLS